MGASRCKGNGPALQGARAFGGGSPVREVGTSSCWAPPPSRQPQRGSAAPYHGRLGAMTRWGDKVRVGDIRQWYAARQGLVVRPAPLSHHCDAQGAQGVLKGLRPKLAWPPQLGSYLTVCTRGREPSWESRYVQQGRKRRQPPTSGSERSCMYPSHLGLHVHVSQRLQALPDSNDWARFSARDCRKHTHKRPNGHAHDAVRG